MNKSSLLIILILSLAACSRVAPPMPVQPLPTSAQLEWQEMEYYAFIHFNMNTFTNQEWGFGDEDPAIFNPTELDCRQWAQVCKEAGMEGIILTVKHHDGFCLWPSQYTEHSVKNSPWREGKGDLVAELAEACREYDLKLGIYYSPWDRNHADYGKPEYLSYMRNQLKELLTQYGSVYELWFDGANGGTGYYGGANEERRVDKKNYYDWPNTHALVRELQPNTLMFSDAGPDIRWVGNESGYAFRTMWSNLVRDSVYPGMVEYSELYASGQEDGTHWVPGETNVSIRPGWYYHEYEDHKVRPLIDLVDMYYESIGRNTTWLLNFPVDKRGLIHENDVRQLKKLTEIIKEDFQEELAGGQSIEATNSRGGDFSPEKILDGNTETYWAAEDDTLEVSLTLTFDAPLSFNRLLLQEYIALGQRVKSFSVAIKEEGVWREIARETTIGYKRILRLPETTTEALRLTIHDAKACPTLSNLGLYHAPALLVPPKIRRNKAGEISLDVPDVWVEVYYTLDDSRPGTNSKRYNKAFTLSEPAVVKAFAYDPQTQRSSEINIVEFDLPKTSWQVLHPDPKASQIIDEDPNTWWGLPENSAKQEVIIDLGEKIVLEGFTYLPMQDRWISGFIKDYQLFVSKNRLIWNLAAEGEFGNIENSPTWQRISFKAREARYLKLKAKTTVDGKAPTFGEIGIISQ